MASDEKTTVDFVLPGIGSIVATVDYGTIEQAWAAMSELGYIDGVTKAKPQKVRFFRSGIAMAEHAKPATVETPPEKRIIIPGAH